MFESLHLFARRFRVFLGMGNSAKVPSGSAFALACTLGVLPFCMAPAPARAQAVTTADRVAGVSAFAMGSKVYTDYGQKDYGWTIGADYTRYWHHFAPSIEGRYTHALGGEYGDITENSISGGIKAEIAYRRARPYAGLMLGYGTINFIGANNGYPSDNSAIYGVIGGVDYRLTNSFFVKGDAYYQYWHLGDANSALTPLVLSVGISYRVPFGWAPHVHKH